MASPRLPSTLNLKINSYERLIILITQNIMLDCHYIVFFCLEIFISFFCVFIC